MHDEIVPVLMEFIDVAANSSISINITTPGLNWSLGCRFGDTLGLSYNVVPDGVASGVSCIQELMFNDSLLLIRTAADTQPLNSFTLSLFMRRQDATDSLMGYCNLNEEAVVSVQFGSQRPVQWRDGRISALLQPMAGDFRQVLFAIRGARPGSVIDIDLATRTDMGEVAWTLGPAFADTQGIRITSSGKGIPISSLSYTPSKIRIVTQQTGGLDARDIAILAYVSWKPRGHQFIHLKADCSYGIDVYAQVGNRQPQFLSQTFTLFTL